MTPLVVDLGCGAAGDVALVGGKAMGLERLMAASLPCPPAYCVTTAALGRYLDERGLRPRLAALLEAAPARSALRELRGLAFEEELPAELEHDLAARAGSSALFAVRSSAADEDGDEHSFAGLHETELGITAAGVPAAVRKCWASLWSEASIAYRRENGLPLADAAMAVVVQALVPAEASAVVFTANPLTGARDEVIVHATRGLGPTLVDNAVTPDTAVIAKADLSITRLDVGDKHLRIDARPGGGIVRSRASRDAAAVPEESFRELARLAVEVEQALGTPIDVEAAFDGRWHLIQARPITTLAAAEPTAAAVEVAA
jgi:phosphoenolpyruvate synthase/pyruvate phosphate dikinase